MKIQSLASLVFASLTVLHAANAQVPKLEQKTAFCATSVELIGKRRESSEVYLCENSEHTCGPYLTPSCLDDAKKGDWAVISETRKSLLKNFANTPCNCVGTEYQLTRNVSVAAPATDTKTPTGMAAAPAALPAATSVAVNPVPAADAPIGSLAAEVEGLKRDNQQIRRQIEQLQRQFDELRRSLPSAK